MRSSKIELKTSPRSDCLGRQTKRKEDILNNREKYLHVFISRAVFLYHLYVWGSSLELTPSEGMEYLGDGKARLGNAFNELVDDNYRVHWLGLDVQQAWTRAMTNTL